MDTPVSTLHHNDHYGGSKNGNFVLIKPEKTQLCILCAVDEVEVPAIARVFRKIHRSNKERGLPYGFSNPADNWFDDDGRVASHISGRGLCCHTFVLAAYIAAGKPLISPLNAPSRPDDYDLQFTFLNRVSHLIKKAKRDTQEHFAIIKENIGTPLYRPLEVAGSACSNPLPSTLNQAKFKGFLLKPLIPEQRWLRFQRMLCHRILPFNYRSNYISR